MIASSTKVEANSHLSADVIIAGAGAAGIVLAKRLAESGRSVILLEGGGLEADESSQSLYQGVIVGQPTDPTDASRLRFFGGTTNHWGGWCRPLEAHDFQKRADWPESGWPIARADLDPYYKDAAKLCGLGPTSFDDVSFWQRQKSGGDYTEFPFDPDLLKTALFQISQFYNFGQTHKPALAAAPNLKVLLNANALELLPAHASRKDQARKSIGAIRVRRNDKQTFTVSGRAYVVALGGLETARMLLLSDKVHPAGAGNENDLVGRYFMDHPWLTEACYLRFPHRGFSAPLYFGLPYPQKIDGAMVFGAAASAPGLPQREKTGGFRFLFYPSNVSTDGTSSARTLLDDFKHGKWPDHLGQHLGNIFADMDILASATYKSVTGSRQSPFQESGSGAAVGAFVDLTFEQRPNRDSRVMLDRSLDVFGQRRLKLDWRLGETDKRTAMRALDIAAHEFSRAGLGRSRIRIDVANGKPWPPELRGSCHHSGTARMADDPKMGVVNADCRVHSTDNLYIAGSAVFPTQGYVNPTLTIVALACRLADHLTRVLA